MKTILVFLLSFFFSSEALAVADKERGLLRGGNEDEGVNEDPFRSLLFSQTFPEESVCPTVEADSWPFRTRIMVDYYRNALSNRILGITPGSDSVGAFQGISAPRGCGYLSWFPIFFPCPISTAFVIEEDDDNSCMLFVNLDTNQYLAAAAEDVNGTDPGLYVVANEDLTDDIILNGEVRFFDYSLGFEFDESIFDIVELNAVWIRENRPEAFDTFADAECEGRGTFGGLTIPCAIFSVTNAANGGRLYAEANQDASAGFGVRFPDSSTSATTVNDDEYWVLNTYFTHRDAVLDPIVSKEFVGYYYGQLGCCGNSDIEWGALDDLILDVEEDGYLWIDYFQMIAPKEYTFDPETNNLVWDTPDSFGNITFFTNVSGEFWSDWETPCLGMCFHGMVDQKLEGIGPLNYRGYVGLGSMWSGEYSAELQGDNGIWGSGGMLPMNITYEGDLYIDGSLVPEYKFDATTDILEWQAGNLSSGKVTFITEKTDDDYFGDFPNNAFEGYGFIGEYNSTDGTSAAYRGYILSTVIVSLNAGEPSGNFNLDRLDTVTFKIEVPPGNAASCYTSADNGDLDIYGKVGQQLYLYTANETTAALEEPIDTDCPNQMDFDSNETCEGPVNSKDSSVFFYVTVYAYDTTREASITCALSVPDEDESVSIGRGDPEGFDGF